MPKFNNSKSVSEQQHAGNYFGYDDNADYPTLDNSYEQQEKQKGKVSKKLGEIGMKLAGMKPVWVPAMSGSNIMTENTYKQYSVFESAVQQSRYNNNDFGYHSLPSKKEFKKWKKTGLLPGERAAQVTNQVLGYEPLPNSGYAPNNEPYYMNSPFQASQMEQADPFHPPQGPFTPAYNTNPFVAPDAHPTPYDSLTQMQASQALTDFYNSQHTTMPFAEQATQPYETSAPIVLNRSQEEIWSTYRDNMKAEAAPVDAKLDGNEIRSRMEVNHVVKQAPHLVDQMRDTARNNDVTYIAGQSYALRTGTSNDVYKPNREAITEQGALTKLYDFLDKVSAKDGVEDSKRAKARSMMENLTFIGEKEHQEAAAGIAASWKGELDKNPNLQIYAVAGEIAKSGTPGTGSGDMVKSDEYLLDKILGNFSDEDREKYAGRLVTEMEAVSATNADDLRVVLLDDWSISGTQVRDTTRYFLNKHPQFKKSLEVQLVASNEERIKNGIRVFDHTGFQTDKIPLKAYYLANTPTNAEHGAHITGFHSSVDFDFENDIQNMVTEMRYAGEEVSMPPLTNIVRPYRLEGVELKNKDRFSSPKVTVEAPPEVLVGAGYSGNTAPIKIEGYDNFPF